MGQIFKFVGYLFNGLLFYVLMVESLFALGIFWHVVQMIPGLIESIGYVYGMVVASFTLELIYAYMDSDPE